VKREREMEGGREKWREEGGRKEEEGREGEEKGEVREQEGREEST